MNQSPFVTHLKEVIAEKHLLTHPFYQHWSAGTLPVGVMQEYAKQYYHLEKNFPRLLSRVHTNCDEPRVRQVLSDNLHDEEYGEKNHRELWLRFAEGLGVKRDAVEQSEMLPETKATIASLMEACDAGTLSGIGALSAYESQIPAVATSKIDGLKKHYGIADARSTEFFTLHGEVDVEHSNAWWDIVDERAVSDSERAETERGVVAGRNALWDFLDGVCRAYFPEAAMAC
ncbi:MAG: CADD family putative folate metabolism protein [Patescibacteria group bacterium]